MKPSDPPTPLELDSKHCNTCVHGPRATGPDCYFCLDPGYGYNPSALSLPFWEKSGEIRRYEDG